MIIDWTSAPEGTTHGMTVGRGEVRWYRVGDNVECWSVTIGWTQSFFLTKEEFNDVGLHLYEHGEQSELVMLREQRDALLTAVNEARDYLGGLCDGGPVLLGLVCVLDDAIALVEGTK